jgi:nucleoside-diphosphate-sugar epimerase
VVGLDNFDPFYDRRIKEAALAELQEERGFSFVEGDIRDASLLPQVLERVDVVLHLAARAGVTVQLGQRGRYHATAGGMSDLWRAALRVWVVIVGVW